MAKTGDTIWSAAATARPRSVAKSSRRAEGAPSPLLSTIRRFFLSFPLRRTNGVPLVPSSRYGRRSLLAGYLSSSPVSEQDLEAGHHIRPGRCRRRPAYNPVAHDRVRFRARTCRKNGAGLDTRRTHARDRSGGHADRRVGHFPAGERASSGTEGRAQSRTRRP